MKLLNEYFQPVKNEEALGQNFWIYDIDERDFFLEWTPSWEVLEADIFHFRIGDQKIWLPDGFYILLAAPCGSLDWIVMGETIGRDLTCVTMSRTIDRDSWSIKPLIPYGSDNDQTIYFPSTNYPVVCSLGDDQSIIVSKKDHYYKMRYHDITDIV